MQAGTRCAIFNLGISFFDIVCDHLPQVAVRLGGLLDEHVLRDLAGAPGRVARLARDAEALADPELQLLLGVVAAFYALGPAEGEHSGLAEQLVSAHRAQMLSVGRADVSSDLALAAAREKSTLPFAMIGVIAAGGRPDADIASSLAERVGVAFWLADDLADAAVDFDNGALNALLVDAYEGFGPGAYPHAGPGPLGRILEDGTIERTAETVGARLGEAVELANAAGGDAGSRLGEVLVCAMRDWLA
ncbi:MAG TPA: hypothetical protein VNT03_13455 [Baekduia sp.]|nr:hypothetical protein [Baekduia sp.]